MPEPHVIVFLKAPRLGTVKTRLAATIGDAAALEAYLAMTETVLRKLTQSTNVQLRFTPDDAEPEIRPWLQNGWQAVPQGEGDLGERMQRAFADADGPVLIIGTDCPSMQANDLTEAADALQDFDIVLGPALDGGYWLIGLNAPCPALFDGIIWSTDQVLNQTLARVKAAGLTCQLLREQADVDTEEDWKNWSG